MEEFKKMYLLGWGRAKTSGAFWLKINFLAVIEIKKS